LKRFVQNSIDNLKQVLENRDLEEWKRKDLLKASLAILESDQNQFEAWIKLFIKNHEDWLIPARYSDQLENAYASEFEYCLDNLEEGHFKNIIAFIEESVISKDNIPASIFLLEAARFGYMKPSEELLSQQSFHRRHINPEIKKVFEIHFPDNYQHKLKSTFERQYYWEDLTPEDQTHKFGGRVPALYLQDVHRILTISPLPAELKITSVQKLTIAFNFDKAFWLPINVDVPYFIKHNKEGEPIEEYNTIPKEEIEFYKGNPLEECEVLIKETPQKYIHHHRSKNEWRIGGMPNWVQKPQKVTCPICNNNMNFIIQLPSGNLWDTEGEYVHYGSDGGTTYGFWCDQDQMMGYIWQDT